MARIHVTPEELYGYRPIPGYSRNKNDRLPDLPGGSYSIATRGRSARRYYNPSMAPDDPRREIGDATYFRLRREAPPEVQRQAKAYQERFSAMRRERERGAVEEAEQAGLPPDMAATARRELSVENYTTTWGESNVTPAGYKANLLVALGYRPPDAPWNVGESDMEVSSVAPGVSPLTAMGDWRSQSEARGRVL